MKATSTAAAVESASPSVRSASAATMPAMLRERSTGRAS
jgi:hypothetical protein